MREEAHTLRDRLLSQLRAASGAATLLDMRRCGSLALRVLLRLACRGTKGWPGADAHA